MSASYDPSRYVLVIDADVRRMNSRVDQLRLDGWKAEGASHDSAARELLAGAELVVLGDLGTPAASLQLLRDLRAAKLDSVNADLRVIAAADSEPQMLSAYAAGADLTLPRNASATVVSASAAALKRRNWNRPDVVRLGALEVDRAGRTATLNGQPVQLTRREFALLDAMAQAPGRVFTRDELSREIWGIPQHLAGRTIDAHASRLARKLRAPGALSAVQNVWGVGYKLNDTTRGDR